MTLSLPEPASPLAERLLHPAETVALAELPARWFHQTVEVVVAGRGERAGDPALPGRLRGAWGAELMRAASDAALAGRPCPWDPPCALDVLMREQGRMTAGLMLPRPAVIRAERRGRDLVVRLTLFGFACDWIEAAAEALVAALRQGDPLRAAGPGGRDPAESVTVIRARRLLSAEGLSVPAAAAAAELTLVTPLQLRRGTETAFDGLGSLVASLGNRISGLARWQDCAVAADWRGLVAFAENLRCDAELRPVRWMRWSGRQGGRAIPMDGLIGRIVIDGGPGNGPGGGLGPLVPLLALGATAHAGSHAALGLGAYDLTLIGGGAESAATNGA